MLYWTYLDWDDMKKARFDRDRLYIRSLNERLNKLSFTDILPIEFRPVMEIAETAARIKKTAKRIKEARSRSKPVIMAFGAHTIKNGLALFLIEMMRKGWVTHLATNGAGIIHDWEFAYQGKTSEDVRTNVSEGKFGIWNETGFYIGLALLAGAWEDLGYGESVGKMISREKLVLPCLEELYKEAGECMVTNPERASSAIELAAAIKKWGLVPGALEIKHPYRSCSVQAAAYELGIPFTGHPMIGHDIIYTHPALSGSAAGRTAMNDFLSFVESVSMIDGGVYLSMGSAVMSPMIFEKSLSMAQNVAISNKQHIENHYMLVVDLAPSAWDWKKHGEPPAGDPSYYLRYCKTFSRMGGEFSYLQADNRDFLASLYHELNH
jgi:hypothetical protein